MQIGKLARGARLTPDAIRFYERQAILPRPIRSPGGFRQYTESDLETLKFIRRAQGLGFTLKEVRELLELRRTGLQPCDPVRRRLHDKLAQVRRKLADFRDLERELSLALRRCDSALRRRPARCPLLSAANARWPGKRG